LIRAGGKLEAAISAPSLAELISASSSHAIQPNAPVVPSVLAFRFPSTPPSLVNGGGSAQP